MADDLKDAVERVKAVAAITPNEALAADLRTLLSALDRPEEKKDVLPEPTQPLASQEARGRTEAGTSGAGELREKVARIVRWAVNGALCNPAELRTDVVDHTTDAILSLLEAPTPSGEVSGSTEHLTGAQLRFEGGGLTLDFRKGRGHFAFTDDELEPVREYDEDGVWDGHLVRLPNSELAAIRDFLNKWLPDPPPSTDTATSGEGGA